MPTLEQALASFFKTVRGSPPENGDSTPAPTMDGTPIASTPLGVPLAATTTAPIAPNPQNVTGSGPGVTGVTKTPPKTQEQLAEAAMTYWLPPVAESYLNFMESIPAEVQGANTTRERLLAQSAPPVLTPEQKEQVQVALNTLTRTTLPSRNSPQALLEAIKTLLSGFKWRTTGGEENVTTQLKIWCEVVGDYPLYAVEKAVRWALLGQDKEPSIAAFVADVKLASGKVAERHALLKQLVLRP